MLPPVGRALAAVLASEDAAAGEHDFAEAQLHLALNRSGSVTADEQLRHANGLAAGGEVPAACDALRSLATLQPRRAATGKPPSGR